MNIVCRTYLYKVVTPSNKSRLITSWNEGDPIEDFKAFDKIKFPLGTTDTEITSKYHEITKAKANKILAERDGVKDVPEETTSGDDQEL